VYLAHLVPLRGQSGYEYSLIEHMSCLDRQYGGQQGGLAWKYETALKQTTFAYETRYWS
jgi:hypothetical protein